MYEVHIYTFIRFLLDLFQLLALNNLFFSHLTQVFKVINFPLNTTLATFHYFLYMAFSVSIFSKYPAISFWFSLAKGYLIKIFIISNRLIFGLSLLHLYSFSPGLFVRMWLSLFLLRSLESLCGWMFLSTSEMM